MVYCISFYTTLLKLGNKAYLSICEMSLNFLADLDNIFIIQFMFLPDFLWLMLD